MIVRFLGKSRNLRTGRGDFSLPARSRSRLRKARASAGVGRSAKAGRPLEREANPAFGGTPLPSRPGKVRHYELSSLPIDSVHLSLYIILPSGFDEDGHYKANQFDIERRKQACPRMSIFARNVRRSLLLF
jgi:hypothetical protein